tara:strand:+ start:1106 stop:3331 length:2226 start_codon:yes stop_codon:yes gene_type:complete
MKNIILSFISLFFVNSLSAQSSLNLNYLSNFNYANQLNDIWGYANESGEYALVGVTNGVSVVDITNPSQPTELGFFEAPNSIWRDLKTYENYLYCVNESSGGLQIINLEELIAGNSDLSSIQNEELGFTSAHNIYVDENGVLYVFGANFGGGGAMMFDLSQNPESPVYLGNYDGSYFHDAMVRGDTLWGGAIYNGEFSIVDVSDKANPVLLASQSTPSNFTHNSWISDDGNTVFTTDEISGAFVTAYDVSDLNNIEELDRIQAWSNDTDVIPHNTHVDGDFLVTSYYRDGVSVVDASNPSNLIEVAYYDSSPDYEGNGFNGAWGTYPYLPSGHILISDVENGLFVVERKFTNASFIQGTVTNSLTEAPISNATVQILGSNNPSISSLAGLYETGMADPGIYTMEVSAEGYISQQISISIQTGEITELNIQLISTGCMDVNACNYNPYALTDDGSCAEIDVCGDCGGNGPNIGYDCDGNCIAESFTLEMTDSYGDGWNGNFISFNNMEFSLSSGSESSEVFCYDPLNGCLEITCDGGDWQEEIAWVISSDNEVLISGGAPFQDGLCNFSIPSQTCQTINLSAGWSIFSTYIQSADMNVPSLFSELIAQDNLVIIKNYAGAAYLPNYDLNVIGLVENQQGYLIKITNPQSIELCGEHVLPEQTPISLNQGWGLFSYLRTEPADAQAVFSDILTDVVIIKNNLGSAYLVDYGFNGIGDLMPGNGYQIKMSNPNTLLYLSNNLEY